MSARTQLDRYLATAIGPHEQVELVTVAQLRQGGVGQRLAKDVGTSLAATAVTSAVGLGVMRTTTPPVVWFVVTEARLLVIERPTSGARVGQVVLDVPRSAVAAVDTSGVLGAFELVDARERTPFARFNVGLRRAAGRQVVAALS